MRTLRADAVAFVACEQLAALGDAESEGAADRIDMAEMAFAKFAKYLAEPGMEAVPVAAFAEWLARQANADERRATAAGESIDAIDAARVRRSNWIADAWGIQPGSDAAIRAVWLHAEAASAFDAALHYHLALRALADAPMSAVKAETYFRLAQSLGELGLGRAPISDEVNAREMALRCVMRVARPDGSLRPEVAAATGDARDEFADAVADWLHVVRRISAFGPYSFAEIDRSANPIRAVKFTKRTTLEWFDLLPPESAGLAPWNAVSRGSLDLAALFRGVDGLEVGDEPEFNVCYSPTRCTKLYCAAPTNPPARKRSMSSRRAPTWR